MGAVASNSKKWIIRDTASRITGPFTTEKILYKIGRGEITGDETIAYYPGGAWIAMSKDPQFYDKLLEALSDQEERMPTETSSYEEDLQNDHTRLDSRQATKQDVNPIDAMNTDEQRPAELYGSAAERAISYQKKSSRKKKRRRKAQDIELVDTRGQVFREVLWRARGPLGVAAIGFFLVWMFWTPAPSPEERIHLIAPQKNQPPKEADVVKGRFKHGAVEFERDTFEGYLAAQSNLVQAVEADAKNSDVMALLCMTYLELWPYAYQDSADRRTVAGLVQMSSAIDPGGVNSSVCRTVDLIVQARHPEAKSLTEAMLESRANQEQQPTYFYYLKGLLMAETSDYATAVGYLHSAEGLWQTWLHPYVLEAQSDIKMEKYNDAGVLLRKVLAANPRHSVAKIELGILEYKYFNHPDRGQQLLDDGLGGLAPMETLSRGFFGLAEIELKAGNQTKALSFAQKSYSMNSSNNLAKNLIFQIGGVDVVRKTKVKSTQLVFEGDQFMREGEYNAAQAHYRAAFDEDKHNAVAAMKAAEALWKLSFSTEAIDWLNTAIRTDPKLIEAYVLMADYHTRRFNFVSASKILAAASRLNPKSPEVLRGYAQLELRRGNPQGAIAWGKKALALYETDVETQILMAEAYIAAGSAEDLQLAYNYAAKAIEIDVNHRRAQTIYADTVMGLQGADVAIDYLLKLIASYPLVVDYRLALGKLYLKDERYHDAEEIFKQIIKIEEKPKDAYIEMAKVLKFEHQLNLALEYLLKAAVMDPADAEPLFQAGLIYLETRNGQRAQAQFQRVLKINKLFPLVHYQMGRAAMFMGNAEEALEETRQEKAINPNLADAYLLAAEAYANSKPPQYSLCATEYQKAIKLRAQDALTYVKLAGCYRKAVNLDASQDMLDHAFTLEKGLADIYKEQGAIYEQRNEIRSAIEAYNQYFTLDPNAPDRQQIELRILTLQQGKHNGE